MLAILLLADLFIPVCDGTSTIPMLDSRNAITEGVLSGAASGARVITLATGIPIHRRAVAFPTPPVTSTPHSITLAPSKDNTLYQTTDGSLSNGSGSHLFTGATGQGLARRALLAFDLASQIPPGSTITKVTLTMRVSKTINSDQAIALHAVTKNWSEGPSVADNPFGRDGSGAASQPGDATWIHSSFPNTRWTNAGGDFNAAVDGTTTAQSLGDVTWASSASMIARVQSWVDQPATNFGWILIGNESSVVTTKRFDSREIVPAATRPALTIDYTTH